MLILQCVRQFMSHDRFLPFKFDPVSQIELLSFWIVVTGYLFCEQLDYEWTVLELGVHKSEFFQRELGRMHLGGSGLLVKVFHDHALNLRTRLGATFHRSKNW